MKVEVHDKCTFCVLFIVQRQEHTKNLPTSAWNISVKFNKMQNQLQLNDK